jgi:peptidyl-prolyl cis-trans isomerase C
MGHSRASRIYEGVRFSPTGEIAPGTKDFPMLRFTLRATASACALWAGVALAQAPAQAPAAKDPVVARVDGQDILQSDVVAVQRALPEQYQQVPIEMLFPAILDRLVNTRIVANAGRKDKLQNDDEVKRRVTNYEEQVIQQVYINRKVTPAITEAALRERYAKFSKENPGKEEVNARHILVKTEAEAKQIIADIKKGGDFIAIAKAKTTDPSGKTNGGDLGFFGRGEMVPEFSEAAFKLKDGEMTDTPVKTQFGFHVIKVEKRRTQQQPFEEVQEALADQMFQEAATAEMEKLRTAAKVERFNFDGTAVAPAPAAPTITPAPAAPAAPPARR